ncbi:MAG: ComF family protein [Dysgonamonadaceae bacterium]|jgi:ComF family protein|nr:ComF family protein [Dysgonamonadaceae bacterium]
MNLLNLIQTFISLFYPKLCVLCGDPLVEGENYFCLECFLKLPKTNYHLNVENPATARFAGKIPLVKAASYLYYNKGGISQTLIAEIKYKDNRDLGEWMGAFVAKEWLPSGFFSGIDCLIPVPLHPSKERQRGFNQAEAIAAGISRITNIPVDTENVFRTRANVSQTKKDSFERWKNTVGLFDVKNPDAFKDKHILIVDDVLTTGSTIESVAQSILKANGVQINFLSLAIT